MPDIFLFKQLVMARERVVAEKCRANNFNDQSNDKGMLVDEGPTSNSHTTTVPKYELRMIDSKIHIILQNQ